ncbi:MAG TPA: virion core protein (lumpy skin disease virus) [Coriobacteriia bacterium]|nr:virion core protein (lumpy skin disease virus) [Coriobacteriia bacterium]
MGLVRAIGGAVGGQLADQWREYFYCEALSIYTLGAKGVKRIDPRRSSNVSGSDNVISQGSIIAVNEGQCALIVEQGRVLEICAEPGEYIFDSEKEPTILTEGFDQGITESIAAIGRRITFGGGAGNDQRVYFFNTKEIIDNRYGTVNPIPFRVVDEKIGLDIDIAVICNGIYSYRIKDPVLFYTNVSGNFDDRFLRGVIDAQLKSELLTALQPAFARLSQRGIRYSAVPAYTEDLARFLNEELSDKWQKTRGIEIVSFGVNGVSASKEDQQLIKELQKAAVLRDPDMAAAMMVGSQADAMRGAAENEGGAMLGFMGLSAARQAGEVDAQSLYAPGHALREPVPAVGDAPRPVWACTCGFDGNKGKFCEECGESKPMEGAWTCSCGATNGNRFCSECGSPRP